MYDSLNSPDGAFTLTSTPRLYRYLVPLALAVLLTAAACGSDDDEPTDTPAPGQTTAPGQTAPPTDLPAAPSPAFDRSGEPWNIVVSMPIFVDMLREIAGDQVTITSLIPFGADPHTYVPPEDLADEVLDADIIFVNGLGLDQPAVSFVESHRPDRAQYVIDFVRNVPSPSRPQPVDRPIYAKDVGDDPHLFLDVTLVKVYFETMNHTLNIIDGINQPYYDARYQAVRQRLTELDESVSAKTAEIPGSQRDLLVMTHNSLTHFANRYGLSVAATIADDGVDGVRETINQRNPPAIFTEVGLDNTALEAIAEDMDVEVCAIPTDTVDSEETSYFEMMEALTDKLVECLD